MQDEERFVHVDRFGVLVVHRFGVHVVDLVVAGGVRSKRVERSLSLSLSVCLPFLTLKTTAKQG